MKTNIETLVEYNLTSLKDKDKHFYEDDVGYPRFLADVQKFYYCSTIDSKLSYFQRNSDYVYEFNKKMDILLSTTMEVKVPMLRVKDEHKDKFRIAWSSRFAFTMIEGASFTTDGSEIQKLDRISLDLNYQYYVKNKKQYRRMIGDTRDLTDFNDMHPSKEIVLPLPWSYSDKIEKAFPLFLCQNSKITQDYTFNLDILKLIRMQYRSDEEGEDWRDIIPNGEVLEKIDNIPVPNIWAKYAKIGDTEKTQCLDLVKTKPLVQLFDDYSITSSRWCVKSGENVIIPFYSMGPVKAFFWMAEDYEKMLNNEYYYYTMYSKGYACYDESPLLDTGLEYGPMKKFPDVPETFLQDLTCYQNFDECYPDNRGYNCYSVSFKPKNSLDITLNINGNFVAVVKTEKDILKRYGLSKDEIVDDSSARKYNIYVCLQKISEIKFENGQCVKMN